MLYWGGRLLALWEAGKPHLMDEVSLATSRESDVGGVLKAGEPFSAHPRYDARTGRLVNFAYKPNPLTGTEVSFYEFDADFRPVDPDRPRLRHTLPGFVLMHDFVITENYYVVSAPPTKFSGGLDALLGRASAGARRGAGSAAGARPTPRGRCFGFAACSHERPPGRSPARPAAAPALAARSGMH